MKVMSLFLQEKKRKTRKAFKGFEEDEREEEYVYDDGVSLQRM